MFSDAGFVKVWVPELIQPLGRLRQEIYAVFNTIATSLGEHSVDCDADIIHLYHKNQPAQFQGVKLLWGSPSLMGIAGHEKISKVLRQTGLTLPLLELPPVLRCDMPVRTQSIFEQHQDYPYNIGSSNSVTVWIPLQDTSNHEGALLVARGSHVAGVYPNHQGIIPESLKFDFQSCETRLGEILIFNQKIVHQSGRNTSDIIRFSIQLRFSDIADKEYARRGWPINHKVTTESFAGDTSVAPVLTGA